MKKYVITALSISTHLGVTLRQGEVVNEERFHKDHIADLINNKMIKEYVSPADAKIARNTELQAMNAGALATICTDKGITVAEGAKKPDLIEAILQAEFPA